MTGKILGTKDLKQILPYRYPMLMLDRVAVESETKYVGLKNLTINELFFQGHFPSHPIMPGVLQIEAMKQLAQVMVHDKINPTGELNIYIKKLEKVKFRKPNNPGDRVKIEAELVECGENTAVLNCKTSNNSGVTCQTIITLGVRELTGPDAMPELWTENDKSENSLMDVEQIMSLVPHRYPFLLIDNIIKAEGDCVVALKNVSINEEIFAGFPEGQEVLPVSFQCEIIAQAGCACVLSREENRGKLAYFMSIDFAAGLHPIYPGDQIICEINVPAVKSRFGKGTGCIKVGNKVVFESALMFALIDP